MLFSVNGISHACGKFAVYRQFSSIRRTNFKKLNVYRLVLQLSLPHPLKPRLVENEGVVGAAPTSDTVTTSE